MCTDWCDAYVHDTALPNPWYIVAAVAYSASNKAEAVPEVFQYALQELKASKGAESEQFLLAQKIREALFKSGLISGYPKVSRFCSSTGWLLTLGLYRLSTA